MCENNKQWKQINNSDINNEISKDKNKILFDKFDLKEYF